MKENLNKKLVNYKCPAFIMTALANIIVVFMFGMLPGCNKAYLPWANTNERHDPMDDSTVTYEPEPTANSSNQSPTTNSENTLPTEENWCEENKTSVEEWRKYLEPDFDWSNTPAHQQERTKRAIRTIVEHWDRTCS